MVSLSLLALFVPTFFFVSATPGMCMTLAMTLGMTVGVRRALWMMLGELLGVGLIAVLAVVGVAAVMLNYPAAFTVFKWVGGVYLFYLGVQMWLSRGKMAIPEEGQRPVETGARELMMQGFVTAIANPKGWAFCISLLPPFISEDLPVAPQLIILVSIILMIEFVCLNIYAAGGRTLRHFLQKSGNVRVMNRIAGSLMMGVGIWLAFG
ncbi:LysE family translocator [Endozoicomonas sp. SCSIO W0465]|uniref:LysE family translocator n=1 Tax=Endozoicomonas sp. SCSIO W0465 TaxID=2918516 RepID=UPI002074CCBF|nr:LysE family translocator [Endozoicomonas sp. SCSIO W0465]USE38413.1 LysE family translocator [Endozoicomonas sp. SCSIO W0465]